MTKTGVVEKPKRLTPTPEVLRELYMLSGNNCAMPDCDNVIIDGKGVVVGRICHIEAAMSGAARFNKDQTNDERRQLSNLVLMCAGHHIQIDSKKYESEYTLARVKKIKSDHEAKFSGISGSLTKAFKSEFVDATDALNPTDPGSFATLEKLLPDCKVEGADVAKRQEQVSAFIAKMAKVPPKEREFMLSTIKRGIKLGHDYGEICVHIDDIKNSFKIDDDKLKPLGDALKRYSVGDIDLVGMNDGDEYHVEVWKPSEYITWFDIDEFCTKSKNTLEDFIVNLKFGLLA